MAFEESIPPIPEAPPKPTHYRKPRDLVTPSKKASEAGVPRINDPQSPSEVTDYDDRRRNAVPYFVRYGYLSQSMMQVAAGGIPTTHPNYKTYVTEFKAMAKGWQNKMWGMMNEKIFLCQLITYGVLKHNLLVWLANLRNEVYRSSIVPREGQETAAQATARTAQYTRYRTLYQSVKVAWIARVDVAIAEHEGLLSGIRQQKQPNPTKIRQSEKHLKTLNELKLKITDWALLNDNPPDQLDKIEPYLVKFIFLNPHEKVTFWEELFSLDVLASVWSPFAKFIDFDHTWKSSDDARDFFVRSFVEYCQNAYLHVVGPRLVDRKRMSSSKRIVRKYGHKAITPQQAYANNRKLHECHFKRYAGIDLLYMPAGGGKSGKVGSLPNKSLKRRFRAESDDENEDDDANNEEEEDD